VLKLGPFERDEVATALLGSKAFGVGADRLTKRLLNSVK
jgi:hypothetical protein